ncbi:MAG: PepSY-like domain-containing protein [Chitinophagaceae bacterium]|nr:PepSY-like domain-containing protein [Chitinophagaceae bacterium]
MKNLIVGIILCISSAVYAQDIPSSQVPAAALNVFQQQFKSATDAKWEKKPDHYVVKFKMNKIDHKLKIDGAGKIQRHEQDVKQAELPAAVQKQLTAQFAGFKVKDPEKFDEGGKVSYKVELKKDKEERKVIFGADGAVLSNKKD